MAALALRNALRADLFSIADMWVGSFACDPYLRWIQPDDNRWPAFGHAWMMFILDLTFERGHTYLSDPLDVAVAWLPPETALVGPADLERGLAILTEHGGERRAQDALTTIMGARSHDLDAPHWTLQYVGVRVDRQGAGLGAAAVGPMLDVCDRDGLPCTLVSTNPRNLTFYERHGFLVAAEVPTPDGTATLRPMHRPAAARP